MSPMIYCPHCGETLDSRAVFCSRCGKTVQAAPGQPSYPQPYPQSNQGFPPQPGYYPPRMVPPPSNNHMTVILLVVGLGVVIVIAGVVMALLMYNRAPAVEVSGTVVEVPAGITEPAVVVVTEIVMPPTEPPAPTEVAPVADVNYEGISLMLGKGVASGVSTETFPAVPASENTAPWEVGPQQWSIKFNGYLLNNTFHNAEMMVFPIAEYIAIDPNVKERIDRLKTILAGKPASIQGGIPFLPSWNAGEMFHSNIKYLDFQNGSGIRYLTEYGQDVSPANNYALFYSFQGITSDGKYYISAIFPVRHPDLRENTDNMTQQDWNDLRAHYDTYLAQQVDILNNEPDGAFSPGLDLLDNIVVSIKIDK